MATWVKFKLSDPPVAAIIAVSMPSASKSGATKIKSPLRSRSPLPQAKESIRSTRYKSLLFM